MDNPLPGIGDIMEALEGLSSLAVDVRGSAVISQGHLDTNFKKKTRDMAIFNIETELLEWHKLPKGIALKEYAAWVELPSGEVFYCGGGHPVSSDEVYLINPISRSFKKLPSMLNPRHSHAILYINGYVYIFGGIENTLFYGALTNKSERFCLRDSY